VNVVTALLTVVLLAGILLVVLTDATDHTMPSLRSSRPSLIRDWRSRQSGAALTAWWHNNYDLPASDRAIAALADTDANGMELLTTWYMTRPDSSTIAPSATKTPTDASLLRAIKTARRLGLVVVLKPHVDVNTGSQRSDIRPRNPDLWFAAYRRMITHYADLASSAGVNMLVVGTEFGSLSTRTAHWVSVIKTARAHFHGQLTYAAKLPEATRIRFWGALDYIGIDAYVSLTTPTRTNPKVSQLVKAWRYFRDEHGQIHHYYDAIEGLHRIYHRPVLFPELGYQSRYGTAIQPGEDLGLRHKAAQQPQQRAFEAAYEVWHRVPWLAGIYWWDWRARDPNPNDNGYNPRGKLAEQTMRAWNRRAVKT
jgi:hypothetical protein